MDGYPTQENSIIEYVHQVVGNMAPTFKWQNNYFNQHEPWHRILLEMVFIMQAIYHIIMKYTPI